jgi:hypothetical protein
VELRPPVDPDVLLEAVEQLPRDALAALLVTAAARILKEPAPALDPRSPGDRVLTVEEAAQKLNQTSDWLARNGRRLGLTVQLNGKGSKVGYSERACEHLIANAVRENRGPSR